MRTKKHVVIDVETYIDSKSRYSLKALSDIQYIQDPRFELLSVGILYDGKPRVYPGDTADWLDILHKLNEEDHLFVAHNARFDLRVLTLRHGFKPKFVCDTMLMARYLGFAKCALGDLAPLLLNKSKGVLAVDGKRLADLTDTEWIELQRYNAQDLRLTNELYALFSNKLPEVELRLIDQTLKLCLKENRVNWERHTQLIKEGEAGLETLMATDPEIIDIRGSSVKVRKLIKERTGVDPESIDKKKVVLTNLPEEGRRVLSLVWKSKEGEKVLSDLRNLKSRMVNPASNAAYYDLNYSKAVTHRWSSGGEGGASFNIQNMGRDSGIREIWIPDPGHVYVIVDLAQIEARVVAWYAGEAKLLGDFTESRCPYCEFGHYVFGHVLDKAKEKAERTVCKQAILGLGFGMGHRRFGEGLKNQAPEALNLATQALNCDSPEEASQKIVEIYHHTYPNIANMPRLCYRLFIDLIKGGYGDREIGIGIGNCFRARRSGNALIVSLPTGSKLYYRSVTLNREASEKSPWRQEFVARYLAAEGAKAIRYSMPFENVVQATARDILAKQLLAAEAAGLDLRMHTHDEAVFQVPLGSGAESLARVKEIFSTPAPECPGLPIACEAFLSDRYTKDEAHMASFTKHLLGNNVEEKTCAS